MRIYNCHTHIFTLSDTPENFFKYGLSFLPNKLLELLKRWSLNRRVARLALILLKRPYQVRGIAFHLVGLLSSSAEVFRNLKSFYPTDTRFVALPLNFAHTGLGEMKIPYEQQLETLMKVKREYLNECLLFVHIDPREDTAAQNKAFVKKYINKGFLGIKMYPPLGHFPFHPNMEEVYQYAEEQELPIISHCSQGGIYYTGKNIDDLLLRKSFSNGGKSKYGIDTQRKKNKYLCDNFLHPKHYEEVLEQFPKLKLCFAHFGWDSFKKKTERLFYKKDLYNGIKKLIKDYPNVYADVSYSLFDKKFNAMLLNDLKKNEWLQEKVIFGTDYFMTLQENKTEDQLYSAFRKQIGESLFEKLAYENPKRFLSSKNYTAS